jgi:polyisoprenoid-binding protein YceI
MRRLIPLALFALLATSAAAAVSDDPRLAPPGTYRIEPRHSQILFSIRHLGLTDYYGRFEKVAGTLNFDPTAPERSAVSVTIDTGSASVMSSELVGELVGPHVFDSANYPQATFVSTAVSRTGTNTGTMTGNLTLHGVTRPVVFNIVFNGGADSPMGGASYDLGFHATASIKRSDFGLDRMIWSGFVGDDVNLTIEAMFVHQRN